MPLVHKTVVTVLRRFVGEPRRAIYHATTLRELDIDDLDLTIVYLDLEDALNVSLAGDDAGDIKTAGDLFEHARLRLREKRQRAQSSVATTKSKRGWMSTGAEQRR